MRNILLIIFIFSGVLSNCSFAENIMQHSPEEDVAWYLNRHNAAEKLTIEDWHSMLIDLSKDMSKIGAKVLELNEMRPFYRLNMYYSVLGTLSSEDVESVKSANAGTNTLAWCWNLLYPERGLVSTYFNSSEEFAAGWQKTDVRTRFSSESEYNAFVLRFFWFVVQGYAKDIWEEWYSCWKNEVKREEPRKFVTNKLKVDFGYLEAFLLPYLYEAMKAGDETLIYVIMTEGIHSTPNNSDFSTIKTKEHFFVWWEANKNAYKRNLSVENGLAEALENARFSIKYLETSPLETEVLKIWANEIRSYYSKPLAIRDRDYWYYRIGEDKIDNLGDYYKAIDISFGREPR